MAAPRTVWDKVVKFGTLIKDRPNFIFTKFHVSHWSTLAPPTGQSWTCVYTRNFWTVWPIFKNEVPLDSLGQDEFNTPYDVNFRLYRFSAILNFKKTRFFATPPSILVQSSPELAHIIVRPTLTEVIQRFFIFKTVCPVQPIKFGSKDTKQEVGSYLSKSLRNQHQTWCDDSEPSSEDVQSIWCHVITGRGRRKQKCVLANNCRFFGLY